MRRILAIARVPTFDPDNENKLLYDEDNNVVHEERNVYIHHWGTQYETIHQEDGTILVGQYTVAICEDQETHQIHTFMPTTLKITGLTTYY